MISERDVIYITKKQASIALVALATFCILVFMLGYFWGKQCVLEGFGQRIAQESMSDQADYESMMQLFVDKTKPERSSEPMNDLIDDADESLNTNYFGDQFSELREQFEPAAKAISVQPAVEKTATQSKIKKDKKVEPESLQNKNTNSTEVSAESKKWSAILVGFATKQHALAFVKRLRNRSLVVHLKTRVSKSANCKVQKTWYQVVTSQYNSKEELEEAIAQIKKTERLKSSDIKII